MTLGKVGKLEKMGHSLKNESHQGKWVTLGKMGHTWKMALTWRNGSHLKQLLAHKENRSPFKTLIKLGNMGQTWKTGSHVVKWVTLGKMGQT